jgi:hypothetical protein
MTMASAEGNIAISLDSVVNGYGENAIIWEPQIPFGPTPTSDKTYTVSVNNVTSNGSNRNFKYDVIVFNPSIQSTDFIHTLDMNLEIPTMFSWNALNR